MRLGLRGKLASVAALVVGALALLPAAPASAAARASHAAAAVSSGPLTLVADDLVDDPRLHELTLQSPALGHETKVRVLLPAGYDDPSEAARRYPVLFLLHGVGDNQASWTSKTDVTAFDATTPIIIVMPDAGRTPDAGWYSDWQEGPAWETYHIGELLPYVDATYRTTADRATRAIAGLSMGGFGSMSYAARHPELFATAAAFSGAVDTTFGGDVESSAFTLLHSAGGTPSDQVWGPYQTDETRWRTHNPTDLTTNLRWTRLWLACGNGVPAPGDSAATAPFEAGIFTMNVSFDSALIAHGIAHESHFRDHGTHAWNYWQADLHEWWPTLLDALANPQAPPAAFDYRSAEPAFSAWGWSFSTDRPGLQFVDLTGVSPEGFTVIGSGPLVVTTPAAYAPGATYVVSGDDGNAISVVAGADGALNFTVDLGPGHSAPPSPVAGVAVEGVSTDQRATRVISIKSEAEAAAASRAGGDTARPSTLPATGSDSTPAQWAALTLVLAGLAAWRKLRKLRSGPLR